MKRFYVKSLLTATLFLCSLTLSAQSVTFSASVEDNTMSIDAVYTDYPFSAVQFDIVLPEGIEVASYEEDGDLYYEIEPGKAATKSHSAEVANKGNNTYGVVIMSLKNSAYKNGEGQVATATLTTTLESGAYPFYIKAVTLSAPGQEKVVIEDAFAGWITVTDGVTGIKDITIDGADNTEETYDLQGRKVTNMVKGGIYIKGDKKFINK